MVRIVLIWTLRSLYWKLTRYISNQEKHASKISWFDLVFFSSGLQSRRICLAPEQLSSKGGQSSLGWFFPFLKVLKFFSSETMCWSCGSLWWRTWRCWERNTFTESSAWETSTTSTFAHYSLSSPRSVWFSGWSSTTHTWKKVVTLVTMSPPIF